MTRLMLSAILVMQAALAAGQTIRIADRVEVDSDSVLLGDIARISPPSPELEAVSLGYAPYPGHYRWLEKSDVQESLRRWFSKGGVRVEMSAKVLITRQCQAVDTESIRAEVQRYLSSLDPALEFTIRDVRLPQEVLLPLGPVDVAVNPANPPSRLDGFSLKLEFRVDGERQRSQWARVDAVADGKVLVMAHGVRYGASIRPSDLVLEDRQFTHLGAYYTDPSQLIGKTARRALRAGEVATADAFEMPVLVKRGDIVTLVARGGSFVVSTLGKARDSGTQGHAVVVENLSSRQLVHATVIGEKTVQVIVPEGLK